jgi:hypothetical protein
VRIAHLSADEAVATVVDSLGFDGTAADLTAPEVLASAVRRAASFMCPATPRQLVSAVRASVAGLVEDPNDEASFPLRATVDDLAAYGDLIEAPVSTDGGPEQRVLFLAEPAFVMLGTAVLLIGVRADGVPYLSGTSPESIEYDGHVRRLTVGHAMTANDLEALGLREVSAAHWLAHPPLGDAAELVADYDRRLAAAGQAGTIEDCTILDGSTSPTYYRGRWRALSSKDSGTYVARRSAAFGAPLWCYVDVANGEVQRLVDLPAQARLNRACDEAWRLQAALDELRGTPQVVRVERGGRADIVLLHLLSPPPAWAQRRLDAIGRPLPRNRSLLSYALRAAEVEAELDFLQTALWTVRLRDGDPT